MNQIRLARQPFLAVMDFGGKIVGFADEIDIRGWIVSLDFFNQIVNFDVFAHDFRDRAMARSGSIRHSVTREILCPLGLDDRAQDPHRLLHLPIDDVSNHNGLSRRFHLWALASRRRMISWPSVPRAARRRFSSRNEGGKRKIDTACG